ncbi:SDR family oxidoreductase [Allonocardiopsis opalescens]|uniref:Uncharacterized protein YbjT (DUF2867 family) n=1 Tax=Allonocardiopsis opalescens TaxID=1144618 RepID=A0A2T0QEI8_9ACTN|nr:NmrA family NAD(P)-binding protein [Allonocardiopsis opalescens]PRY02300.1 uncharacterized protein YbjT (DUF2867 family) [Allonocardiopsis opalescens]
MTVLVTGATGNVGRELVGQLHRAGHPVRALTRNPERAALPEGVEVVRGDLTEPGTLGPALEGVTAIHLITFGGDDHAELATGAEIVDLAALAGVRRATVLKSSYEPTSVERALVAGPLEWTFVAAVGFMANCLDWADGVRKEGVVREPHGDVPGSVIHEGDIAAVAATVLTGGGHGGRMYTLTGPELLTVHEQVRAIGAAIGREVRFEELTEAEAAERWRAQGYDEESIAFFLQMGRETPGVGRTVLPTVQDITGRPARTFAQWAAEHADAFRG